MPAKRATVAAVAALLTLAGCADAVTGSGQPGNGPLTSAGPTTSGPTTSAPTSGGPTTSAPTTSGPTSGGSSTGAGGFPTNVDSLGILLLKGISSIKSAHLELVESTSGDGIRGIGDEQLSNGQVTAIDLTETVGTVSLRFIGIGTKFYAKLPGEIYRSQSGKPWVELGPSTTNEQLKSIYTSFQQAAQTAAGQTITTFVEAAGSLKLVGTQQFDGTTVGHYAIEVAVSKLPSTFEGKQALINAGLNSVPVDFYVDQQGRTRMVTEHLSVGGQTVDVKVTLTRIDQPVTITAPPSSQVGQS